MILSPHLVSQAKVQERSCKAKIEYHSHVAPGRSLLDKKTKQKNHTHNSQKPEDYFPFT